MIYATLAFFYAVVGATQAYDLVRSPEARRATDGQRMQLAVVMFLFWLPLFLRVLWRLRHEIATAYGRKR